MNRGGPASSTLSERLAAKLEADRKQVEELTLSEHRKLAQSFLDASKAELATIRSAIQGESLTTVQTLRAMLRWPLWTASCCIVTVIMSLTLLWVGTWWMRQDLAETRSAITTERQVLSSLQEQTGGVRIVKAENGMFVVLPRGIDASKTFRCNEQDCIRIGD